MSESCAEIVIRPATPTQWAEALFLLLREYPPATRTQQTAAILLAARAGTTSLDQLFVATVEAKMIGVVWANALPGRIGAMWPPQIRDDASQHDHIASKLIAAAEEATTRLANIALWQASIAPEATIDQRRLIAAGYRPLTLLPQLLTTVGEQGTLPENSPLELVAYNTADFARLCETIEATYEETLDCPELDCMRTTVDCIAGYRAIGVSGEQHWYFVEHDQRTAGCLLLARHDEHQFELIYMGLDSASRRRGWGRLLVNHALRIVRDAGGNALTTAVDERNLPAMTVYERAGFHVWQRRLVMVKQAR